MKYDAACRALAAARSVDEVKGIRDAAQAMRAYAKQAKNKQLEVDAAAIRIRSERRLGEMIAQQWETVGQNEGGRPKTGPDREPVSADDRPTLADVGIDKKLSVRAQKLAAFPDDEFEHRLAEWREQVERDDEHVLVDLLRKRPRGTFGTGNNEWYTPLEYIELAREVMGGIDLDPASSEVAQRTVQATEFFTAEDDGLSHEWRGRIWLNPPYAQPLIVNFVGHLLSELTAGRVTEAMMLTNNYTDTAWFQSAAAACDALCFTRGRIRFVDPEGRPGESPLQGQVFLYFGANVERFCRVFSPCGFVVPTAPLLFQVTG